MAFQLITHYLDTPIQAQRIYDIFVPETIQHDTAIFIIHGGGWRAGSRLGFHSPLMEKFAEEGYITATTDYRLNVTASEQLKDCRDAYMHFVNELRKMGRPLKIAVHGSSAGAHLASLLLVAKPGAAGDDFKGEWVAPECGLLQSCPYSFIPWDEIFPHVWGAMQAVAGEPYQEGSEIYRKLSLDHHLHSEMPRLFFMEAEWEHMFWPPQKISLAKKIAALKCKVAVKIYKNMEHGFFYSLERPHQREAYDDFLKYVEGKQIDNLEFEA